MEITGVLGKNGNEKLNFYVSLKSYNLQSITEWFDCLLKLIKSSMCQQAISYLNSLESYKGNDYTFWIKCS